MLNFAVQVSVNPTGYLHLKKSKHSQNREDYFRDYYQKHREALLIKKKARYLAQKEKEREIREREKVNKKRREGVEQFFPHTRNDSLNSPHAPVSRLRARVKNFFLFVQHHEGQSRWARQKRKDQP